MPSEYGAIRESNTRKYGTDVNKYGPVLLANLYSDRTHFIYELLQNAEDAGATRVRFDLLHHRLEMRHNGRPFNEADVEAICGLAEGTKRDDLTTIGTFGIGFKSVYAYTQSPEVHSLDEHFAIRDYVRPFPVESVPLESDETLFVLPFDHEQISADEAFKAVCERLKALGSRTLLFLRSIEAVEWALPDQEEDGTYLCEISKSAPGQRTVTLLWSRRSSPASLEQEDWLIFDHVVEDTETGRLSAEVAFQLIETDEGSRVIRSHPCPLVVFFPTEKETNLGFLANGPYRTTPARDNIAADDRWNLRLVAETGDLTVAALRSLREMGLLDADALNALPIDGRDFSVGSMFMPIYEKVRNALEAEPLLPAHIGGHVPARRALLARGRGLRELLSGTQLVQVFGGGEEPTWLSEEITAESQSTRELYRYLIEDLGVPEVRPRDLLQAMDRRFLLAQTDAWLVEFYAFLCEQRALLADPALLRLPFVRTEDGDQVEAFSASGKPAVYLPPDGETSMPVVRRSIVSDPRARRFLEQIGLTEPDLKAEVIVNILPKYADRGAAVPIEQLRNDLRRIAELLRSMRDGERRDFLQQELREAHIIPASNAVTNAPELTPIDRCYQATPELRMFFEGNDDAWFVDEICDISVHELDLFCIPSTPRVRAEKPNGAGHVVLNKRHGRHQRGLDGFDPEAEVHGLEHAVAHPTVERALYTWNRVALEHSSLIYGAVQNATRKDYSNATCRDMHSRLGSILIENAWLPSNAGGFHRPSELSLDDLPEDFTPSEPLAERLGMRSSPTREIAHELGLPIETLENWAKLRRANPEKFEELSDAVAELLSAHMSGSSGASSDFNYRSEVEEALNRPGGDSMDDIPEPGPMPDPDGRRQRTADEIERGRSAEPSRDQRQRWITKRQWEPKDEEVRTFLQQQYSGRCQICDYTFAKANGQPYFEGVYLVRHTEAKWVGRPGNVLCLCANCSAKWAHGSLEAPDWYDEIAKWKPSAEGGTEELSVSVRLCGEKVEVTFTERHILELQELLKSGSD